MKNQITIKSIILCLLLLTLSTVCFAQNKTLIKRTTYKTDTVDFGAGGVIAVIGAPNGSISIEGWQKNQVEVTAEIQVQAETETDAAKLAEVCGYTFEQSMGRVSIVSVGTNDKDYMKRAAKKFPKNLLVMPFRIDYKIKVPLYADLEIDGGAGDFSLKNVDGAMRINFLNAAADLTLTGGSISAIFGGGTVNVTIPNRSWRGHSADIQVIKGDLSVNLPANLNAEVTAKILRTGQIDNSFAELKPRERSKFTAQTIFAKAGIGGIPLNFTVGDGSLKITLAK